MAECNYCTHRRLVRKYGDVEVVPETVDGEWPDAVDVRLKSGELVAWFMALPDWCCCDDDREVA